MRWPRMQNDDAGTTLLEIVVGMAVMGVFLSIFTTAIYTMARTQNKVDAVTQSAGQANQAFLKLDKLVRYASAVTNVGKSSTSGDWYVELDTTATNPEVCTQLRVDVTTGQLQQRTWTITGTSAAPTVSAASSWQMLAYGITNGSAAAGSTDQPFSIPAATANSPYQQLTLNLVFKSGSATSATARSRTTFTAINSSSTAGGNGTVCQQKGRP
jgi:type II secretory pathway pseudopilin PulG